jgi:hypothetical protein
MDHTTDYSYEKYLQFNEPIECILEINKDAYESIIKEYGLENKRLYTINGKDCVMTDEEFDKFCQDLMDKGYYVKSMHWEFPDAFSTPVFTERQTLVGNKVRWGENNDN